MHSRGAGAEGWDTQVQLLALRSQDRRVGMTEPLLPAWMLVGFRLQEK